MIIDLIAVLLVIWGFYSGYRRGLIKTVFDTLSILIAFLFTMKLSPFTIELVEKTFKLNEGLSFILGIVLTFFAVMIIIRFIGNRLEGFLKAVNINFINKIAGGALLSIVFAVIFSGLLRLSDELHLVSNDEKSKSITYPVLQPLPNTAILVLEQIKPLFSEMWDKTIDTIDELKTKAEG